MRSLEALAVLPDLVEIVIDQRAVTIPRRTKDAEAAQLPPVHFPKLATADRVVMDGRAGLPRYETTDTTVVRDVAAMFGSLIDAEPRPYPRPDLVLEFFAGTERIARFEVQGLFVSTTVGRWPGDYRLDPDAHGAMRRWAWAITPPAAK